MKTSNKLLLGLLILILSVITVLAVTAKIYLNRNTIAGNGNTTSQIRIIKGFNKIKAKGRMNIYLSQGTDTQLKVNSDANLISLVESKVEAGELVISLNGKIRRGDKIELYLTVDTTVHEMNFSSGVFIESKEVFTGNKLKVETSSGAQALLKLNYHELYLASSSGGDISLSGACDKALFNFSSGGNINAQALAVEYGKAEGNSGGNASINITKELKVDVSSGANLDYTGNAIITSMKQTSGGNISKQ